MYIELLKELYYKERRKLESMWIFKQESKIRLLQLKRAVTEKIEGRLTISELLGRGDIADEVKDQLLRDGKNEDRVKERIEKNISDDFSDIESREKEELENSRYPAEEYADYLFQLEKVSCLEDAISEQRIFPEDAYNEQRGKEEGPGSKG